jgi:HD-GYP domain-containing protein (c-di-GMP phosphodiesterase class II)
MGNSNMQTVATAEAGPLVEAQEVLDKARVFLRSVTDLAEKREILASEDIYAHGGMKLVARGARLSGGFYERLVAHKLLKPIEQTIRIADAPDASRIILLAHEEARRIPSLQPLLGDGLLERLQGLLSGVKIPEPLIIKIAVMQEDRPQLFRHSLLAATVSMVLGIRGNLEPDELHALALGSLLHDIGELYIDSGFFVSGRSLTLEERRHIYAHPITGFLMLREFPELPKGTAEAVLQHHERLDGAGYPNRVPAGKISRVSRYLAVAEVTASLIEKYGADRRIGMKFRMNIHKYDPQAVSMIYRLFKDTELEVEQGMDEQHLMARLRQIGRLFAEWDALLQACSSSDTKAIRPVVDRVDGLRLMVLEPGYDQYRLEDLMDVAGEADPEVCTEIMVLLDELTWHFGALCRGVEREQRVWGMRIPEAIEPGLEAWLSRVRLFVGA